MSEIQHMTYWEIKTHQPVTLLLKKKDGPPELLPAVVVEKDSRWRMLKVKVRFTWLGREMERRLTYVPAERRFVGFLTIIHPNEK